jgi:hypothetical protein
LGALEEAAMSDKPKTLDELQTRALQAATDVALKGMDHGSTICRIPKGGWPADVIRGMADMPQAHDYATLQKLMADPDVSAIFIPASAFVTAQLIDDACRESSLDKTLIWETA